MRQVLKTQRNYLEEDEAQLIVNDPPYNVVVGSANTQNLSKINIEEYIKFSQKWVSNVLSVLDKDAGLYIWLGADQNDGFQPLPEFMIMMREFDELKTQKLHHYEKPREDTAHKKTGCL
ncbi:MAG: DNA methyltransferase [Ignavibacteriaceae bacterium]|nr:DNA methyltransferase [Ignavibacteriaceae bacterium]